MVNQRRACVIRLAVALALLLAGGAGWVWWSMPRPFRKVADVEGVGDSFVPTTTGFLHHVAPWSFALHGWDGCLRWRVDVPIPAAAGADWPGDWVHGRADYCVSPNGHEFAFAINNNPHVVVMRWRDGVPTGQVTVPLVPFRSNRILRLLVLDDGRLYLAQSGQNTHPSTHVSLLERGRVTAHGSYPVEGMLTPDGSVFVAFKDPGYRCLHVTRKGDRLVFTPAQAIRDELYLEVYLQAGTYTYPGLYDRGRLFSEDNVLHRPDGTSQPVVPPFWRHQPTISPHSRYTIITHGRRVRVFSPVTGDQWEVRLPPGDYQYGDVTDDGRYAMICYTREFSPILTALLDRYSIPYSLDVLVIYDRSGRLRARRRLAEDSVWWIAPDGRHVVDISWEGHCRVWAW